jgi:ribosomal protein S12 methylthiotransferase accessory factor
MAVDLQELISADVGMIHRADEALAAFDHPRLTNWFVRSCDPAAVFGAGGRVSAGAAGADRAAARTAALGEAVERYSACHVPATRIRRMNRIVAQQLDIPAVPPDWCGQAAEPADDATPLDWVLGRQLQPNGTSSPAWLPAHRVYLNGVDCDAGVGTATSNGLACHVEPWRALGTALLEVIERDAVMVSWHTRTPGRRIEVEQRWQPGGGPELRFDRAVECYALYLLDSPVDVPVVLAVARGAVGQPAVAVGAAAALDPGTAARKALVECTQTFAWARLMLAQGRSIPEADELTDLEHHVAHYLHPARRTAFDYLDGADSVTLPGGLAEPSALARPPDIGTAADSAAATVLARQQVLTLLGRAHRAGLQCYCVDVTAPDVRSVGAWVIRVVVPGLYPLTVGGEHRRDHPRVAGRFPASPVPHPFP